MQKWREKRQERPTELPLKPTELELFRADKHMSHVGI
jgi:hypothetical protein